jgi:hypothetical protein
MAPTARSSREMRLDAASQTACPRQPYRHAGLILTTLAIWLPPAGHGGDASAADRTRHLSGSLMRYAGWLLAGKSSTRCSRRSRRRVTRSPKERDVLAAARWATAADIAGSSILRGDGQNYLSSAIARQHAQPDRGGHPPSSRHALVSLKFAVPGGDRCVLVVTVSAAGNSSRPCDASPGHEFHRISLGTPVFLGRERGDLL